MISCNVLKWTDIMLSLDIHNAIIPPAPTPVPLPYFHASFLGHGVVASKSKYSGSAETAAKGPVLTVFVQPMLQATDCGYFDVHIGNPANVLLPITIAFSSSKSMFVSGNTQINGSPVTTAALVIMNLNLNCNFPVSLPNGVVYAFSTVQAGMSLGDYLAGVASAVLQMALDFAVGKLVGGVAGLPGVSRVISQVSSRMFVRSVTSSIHVSTPLANALGRYMGTSPIVASVIAGQAAEEVAGGIQGIVLDQTPAEDTINNATTNYIGSGPDDTF